MNCIYTTEGGWDIEVEYTYHKGATPSGGDDPTEISINEICGPYTLRAASDMQIQWLCDGFKIDIEDIESQIRDENL